MDFYNSLAELKNGNTFSSQEELFKKWFPVPINERKPVDEIITMTWYKPRDIVRLIIAAQNSIASNAESFSQDLYTSLTEEYKTLILATFDKNEWHFNAIIKNPKYYYLEDQVVRCVVKDYDREHKKWILEIE